jgi:hypothetical protein
MLIQEGHFDSELISFCDLSNPVIEGAKIGLNDLLTILESGDIVGFDSEDRICQTLEEFTEFQLSMKEKNVQILFARRTYNDWDQFSLLAFYLKKKEIEVLFLTQKKVTEEKKQLRKESLRLRKENERLRKVAREEETLSLKRHIQAIMARPLKSHSLE